MSDVAGSARSLGRGEYAALALRISAAFCLAFWILWDSRTRRIALEMPRQVFFLLPYILLMIHPERWREVSLGVAVGFSLAVALLADFANGFVPGWEAKIPYLAFALANMLLLLISVRCWMAARKSVRAGLISVSALASFAYLWIVVS